MKNKIKAIIALFMLVFCVLFNDAYVADAALMYYTNERAPIYLDPYKGSSSFRVYVNLGSTLYDISTDADWIHINQPWGTSSNTFYFTYDENIFNYERIANIKIVFQEENYLDKNATFQIIQRYNYVEGRTNNLVYIGDQKFNPVAYTSGGQSRASVTYSEPVYLDTVLPVAFKVSNPYNSGASVDSYNSQYIKVNGVTTGPFNGTLYYQLKFSNGSEPKTGNKLYNCPNMQLRANDILITVSFTNVISANAPYVYSGDYSSGGSYTGSSGDFSTPNASQQNWDYMQEYIKKWPNNTP